MRTRAASDFAVFCEAVRTWLQDAVCPDPSLAAVADLVAQTRAEEQVAELATDAADMHAVLGASALLSLWSGLSR